MIRHTVALDVHDVAHALPFTVSPITFCGVQRAYNDDLFFMEKDPKTGKWFNEKPLTCIICLAKVTQHEPR